ncbi:hypothetical protein [Cyclobacterium plantarum]|uniref:hypothetical protein n=1 Tax=Cyclobacterium plantarum TaxID=2716263 RepID=UPI003F706340
MINFNPIRTLGAVAILGLAACNTSYNASRSGEEIDNLYFMASDARIATEFAVKNNNPENFKDIEQIQSLDTDSDNFSSKNVNPEYIAKYQRSTAPVEDEGTVYFDDAETGEGLAQGNPNINAYDNFRGANGNNPVVNNYFMNPMMGMGFNPMMMGMGGFYDPFWGPGFGGMGFYDPFWGPGFGFRPGFNMSIGMGFGFGSRFGWGSPFMRPGMGFYDPFWGPGFGFRPGFGGLYGGGMWGRNIYSPVIVLPGGNEGNRRQLVQSARPSRASSLASSTSRSRNIAQPSSSRAAARRDAMNSSRSVNNNNRSASTRNSFSRSQNDYYNAASAAPSRRNINSPAMNRSGNTSSRSSYNAPSRTSSYSRTQAPASSNSRYNTNRSSNRSSYTAPRSNSRSSSPSYNRSRTNRTSTPSYQQRSTTPSRSTYSAPSRSSSSYSAPSRGSYSGGGASRGGGSVGGSRRGN